MVQGIDRAINRLDTVLVQAATLLRLNESQGTLGKLVRDPRFTMTLLKPRTTSTANTRLRPIIDDVRVFTDKTHVIRTTGCTWGTRSQNWT